MSKKLFLVLLLLKSMLFAGDKQSGMVTIGSDIKESKESKSTKPMSQCDRLAGSPLDPELKGVAYKRVRVLQALKACKQEIKKDPENPRTIFELGRVYNRAGELTLANKYYKKACDKGYPIACYSLGISYRNGEGVKKDIEKTLQYFKSSCQKGVSPACNSIGYIYEQQKQYEAAAKYYKKACLLENGMGCSNLGALHFRKRIHSANDKEAVKMFKLGCAYGNKKSCAYLKRFNIVSDIGELKNDISQLKKNILTPKYKRPSWCNNEKILNETERTICQDKELSEQDLLMESLYKNYVKIYHETNSQKKWLLVRNECMADKSCLMKVYNERIEWLDHENDKHGIAVISKKVEAIPGEVKKQVEQGLNTVITLPSAKSKTARKARYKRSHRTHRNISIGIKYCSSNYNGSSCTVYINGSPKESISYHYEGGYASHYNIYYKSGGGQYYTNTRQLYTPRCNKKYNVGGIGTAMYYMVKCYESGHY